MIPVLITRLLLPKPTPLPQLLEGFVRVPNIPGSAVYAGVVMPARMLKGGVK